MNGKEHLTRRSLIKSMLAAGAAPWIVPAHVRGAGDRTSPSGKLTLGVIGVGAQGQADMRNFLAQDDVRVTALCDVNRRNIENARKHIASAYGSPDVKVFRDFQELTADQSIDAVLMALPFHWHSIAALDAILNWRVRFEFADATPVTFVSEGTPGFEHGIRFLGESAWVHVKRGSLRASHDKFLRDPLNRYDTMPIKLTISKDHTRDFVDAVKQGTRPICDIETAVRSDTLCQIALIAVKQGRKLRWDPRAERFVDDEAANAMLQPRPFHGDWKLPEVG